MKRFSPKLVLSLLSLALVLALFMLDTQRTSPGELSPVHAALAELAGDDGCDRCHGDFGKSMADSCLDCHSAVRATIEARRGLHGTLAGADSMNCVACHVEHHGAQVELAGTRAFALAGIAHRERYDHAALGFRLEGRHAELTCAQCHPQADVALLEPGKPRFLGLAQDCASCHEDPHQGRMARACVDCHGQSQPFATVAEFNHRDAFVSRGAHARAGCLDCHPKDSPRSVEVLGGEHPPRGARGCVDCHASPHAPDFVGAFAGAASLEENDSCLKCHDPERGPFAQAQIPEVEGWHAATGFDLSAPHDRSACQDCHAGYGASGEAIDAQSNFRARYPGRKPDDCAACHEDPHAGQFADDPRGRLGCLGCHERKSFRPSKFDAGAHASTAFALEGAHERAECAQCHQRDPLRPEAALIFAAAPSACSSCHLDAHDGHFARPEILAKFPTLVEKGCALCHDAQAFHHGAAEKLDHAAMAGFVLDGAHGKAGCEACHRRSEKPDDSGRRFGRAAELFGGPVGKCASCHADVHAGLFAARASGADREAGCARCHTSVDFRDGAREHFDHGVWTGFALEGAHARANCEVCHAPLAKPTPQGRSFARASDQFRGPIDRCEGCHDDPHRGRFDRAPAALAQTGAGREGCARCHDQESFKQVDSGSFDHGAWTGFELAGAHAAALCAACHAPTPRERTPGLKLGPASGTACGDCHADPHAGQFEISGKTDCERCHAPDAAFSHSSFDHQRDSRFVLDATHAKLACTACHVPHALSTGASVVRYRPLGTSCADCHGGGARGKVEDG